MTYEESHKEIDGVLYKLCSRCNEWFVCTNENFYKNNKSPDELFPYCKKCCIKKAKEYTQDNYEKHLKSVKKINAKVETREKKRNNKKLYRELGEQLKWQRENKDKIKQYNETRSNKNHNITKEEWLKCKKYFNNSCAYCGISEIDAKKQQGQNLHKEHVIHNGANDLSNCVPSCKICNSSKWTHNFEDWYNEENPIYDYERYVKIKKWLDEVKL